MKRTLLALSAIAALTAVSAGMANAQGVGDGPGGYVGPDHDQGFREERGFRERGGNCHLVIMHRSRPNGSIAVRRSVCDTSLYSETGTAESSDFNLESPPTKTIFYLKSPRPMQIAVGRSQSENALRETRMLLATEAIHPSSAFLFVTGGIPVTGSALCGPG